MLPAGVAAGHPATTDAGIEILEDGGSAADAAVAASLASCVAETVMTGLLGGGHAVHASADATEALDFFCAVPGLGAEPRDSQLLELAVPFGEELVHYAVGPASCAVPGVPAGLDLLWRRHGVLPWERLVEPAIRVARDGVAMPAAHAACLAMLAPVMTMDEGARIYSPGGDLLREGDALRQPGLVEALELVAAEGARTVYEGTIADALLGLIGERDGLVTADDLRAYGALVHDCTSFGYAGRTIETRAALQPLEPVFGALPPLRGLDETRRVLSFLDALDAAAAGPETHTTNIVTADERGNVCVLTTSLGLGSGDFVPGLDLHLNSMLGEVDLLRGPLEPGLRMPSMMSPSVVRDDRGDLELAIGAAGGTRLRTALAGVTAGILDERLDPQDAVDRPRFHPAGDTVNAEEGVDERALAEVERRGRRVRRWPGRHHYFGGVSLIARYGLASDPRRSGSARGPAAP